MKRNITYVFLLLIYDYNYSRIVFIVFIIIIFIHILFIYCRLYSSEEEGEDDQVFVLKGAHQYGVQGAATVSKNRVSNA